MRNIFLSKLYCKYVKKDSTFNTILHTVPMNLESLTGNLIHVNGVVRDNMPDGSNIGCVVAIHDIPGNDKSYCTLFSRMTKKGIRFIAINLPGFGYSSYDKYLKCDSNERLLFTKNICRGCETAIKMTQEYYKKKTIGCVVISPYGIKNDHLRDHTLLFSIDYLFSSIKFFGSHQIKPLLDIIYNFGKNYYHDIHMVKIRGSQPIKRTIQEIDFSTLPPFLEEIEKQKQKFSLVYSSKNKRIKPELSLSLIKYIHKCKFLNVSMGNEKNTIEEIKKNYQNGEINVAINIEYAEHKIQKIAPEFLTDLCEIMLQINKPKNK